MGATFTVNDLSSVFAHVQERQEKEITKLWTREIDPIMSIFEANQESIGDGSGFKTRIESAGSSAVNPNFAIAQEVAQGTAGGNSVERNFWLSHASKLEGVAVWDRDSLLSCVGDPAKAVDVVASEREAAIELMRERMSLFAGGNGWGKIATIVAVATGNHYFTVSKHELYLFRKNDRIVFGATEGSGTLRGTDGTGNYVGWGNPWLVTGIDPTNNRVTVSRSTDHPYDTDGVRDGDTVFLCGYRQNAASPAMVCPIGLGGWLPTTAPTETSFEGVDRRNNPALYGLIFSASGLTHFDAFIEASLTGSNWGAEIDQWLVNLGDYAIMCKDKDRVKTLPMKVGPYQAGFDGIEISGGKGSIKIVPSRFVPKGTSWGGPFKNKKTGPKMKHNGKLVNVDNFDGREFSRLSASTGFEQRLYTRAALIVPAPAKYCTITSLPSS